MDGRVDSGTWEKEGAGRAGGGRLRSGTPSSRRPGRHFEEGTLYPALHRMEREGWLESTWGKTGTGRRARFYAVTEAGAKHLTAEKRAWKARTLVIGRLLGVELA